MGSALRETEEACEGRFSGTVVGRKNKTANMIMGGEVRTYGNVGSSYGERGVLARIWKGGVVPAWLVMRMQENGRKIIRYERLNKTEIKKSLWCHLLTRLLCCSRLVLSVN